MGKKRRSKKESSEDPEENEDTVDSDDEDVDTVFQVNIDDICDSLRETRPTVRIRAINTLDSALVLNNLPKESFVHCLETLVEYLSKSLIQDTTEAVKAAHALGMLAIVLGECDESDALVAVVIDKMISLATDDTQPDAVRCACLSAIAVFLFITAEPTDAALHLDMFQSIWSSRKEGDTLRCVALESWSFLLTSLEYDVYESSGKDLMNILKDASAAHQLKEGAGEAFALVYERKRMYSAEEEGDEWDPDEGGKITIKGDIYRHDLLEIFSEMVAAKSKNVSKRNRKLRRPVFRQLLDSIELGEPLDEVLSFGIPGGVQIPIHFSSWDRLTKLNWFRDYLGNGLNSQMTGNEFLSDVFGLPDFPGRKDKSMKEKFSKSSEYSKNWTTQRQSDRDKRNARVAGYLNEDE